MISHKHKFIFIHIPKNGGTSIENALEKCVESGIKTGPTIHYDKIDKASSEEYFIFACKRNPYDRMVSLWKYWTEWRKYNWRYGRRARKILRKYDNEFSTFCKNFSDYTDTIARYCPAERVHFIPQININGNPNYVSINFWIKFENLQEDFNFICDKIGIPQQQLPHKNATKHKHYTEYYNDETQQIVEEKYAKDIEYFNYKFGG